VDKWTIGCLAPNIWRIFASVKWVTANWKNVVYNIICTVICGIIHTHLLPGPTMHIIDVKWLFFIIIIIFIYYFL
jgi:hypothetical protein